MKRDVPSHMPPVRRVTSPNALASEQGHHHGKALVAKETLDMVEEATLAA